MYHYPVLYSKILQFINDWDLILDCTFWHWSLALKIYENKKIWSYIGLEIDHLILEKWKNRCWFAKIYNLSYTEIDKIDWSFDVIIADFWVNLEHFKDANRWFSIKQDWPLDMRFNLNQKKTAKDVLNYSINDLTNVLVQYWDFSEKIAFLLAKEIKKYNFNTTLQLKNFLRKYLNEKQIVVFFQAIRIEVNDELKNISILLDKFYDKLNKWWRWIFLSYHSLEHRIIREKLKNFKKIWWRLFWPYKPDNKEIKENRASRSALLRVIKKEC